MGRSAFTLAALASITIAAPAFAKGHVARVSIEAARATALERAPGKVIHEEMEKEKGRWIYSFEIRPDGERRKIVKEVNIDADTGVVVGVDTERE
ncbi:MAG: peptidase M4 [Myxococcales bacterium]|nr:peptidase M4 [Myxococcales bacterium]